MIVGYLDQLSESRDEEIFGRAMFHVKETTTPGFLVSLEVINATLNLTKPVAKKATGHQETVFSALDATSITTYKDVIQAFRTNKKYLLDYSDIPKDSTGIHTHASNCEWAR